MTDDPEADARLWLRVSNAGHDLDATLSTLTNDELRTWLEVAQDMDIPRERKRAVARAYNQR